MEDTCNARSGQLLFAFFARLLILFREEGVAESGALVVTSETDAFPVYFFKIDII